tara:strand:- start:150 stop:551 length:402 start_codon:yes stop_codon:yes gene_type:complete
MDKKINKNLSVSVPTSIGELVDKITILEIKKEHMNGLKLTNVEKELKLLNKILNQITEVIDSDLFSKLKEVNMRLWDIEDLIRLKEGRKEFDKEFIELARSVYKKNDIRAFIKKEINIKYNSNLIEEKSYKSY